jgi:hypothetical protein
VKPARQILALFRMENGHRLGDPRFADLVRRLQAVSPEFRTWWPQHEVRQRREEPLAMVHMSAGRIALERIILRVEHDPPLTVRTLVPLPGTDATAKLCALFGAG